MKDGEIIELLRGKEYLRASEKLYGYYPVVKKLVLNNKGNREDAEDLYQEALIILIRKVQIPGFVLSSSLNTYLYSICRFLWSEKLRKQNKRIEVEFENNQAIENSHDLETYKNETENKLAEKAFYELGEKCKQLLLLFYFKKMSMKEIAVKLGFGSEKVAKNQKYRCIEKAKENLQQLKSSGHE
jgi:RNA polymerase sigma factor (sigma-70 family)